MARKHISLAQINLDEQNKSHLYEVMVTDD